MDQWPKTFVILLLATTATNTNGKVPADDKGPDTDTEEVTKAEKKPTDKGEEQKAAASVDYTGSQLWKVSTKNTGIRPILAKMRRCDLISDWEENQYSIEIVVKPTAVANVTHIFKRDNVIYEVIIEDLQTMINEENSPLDEAELRLQARQGHKMTWKQYHRLDDIYSFLDYLETTYPSIVTVKTIGTSYEGREIKMLRLSNGNSGNKDIFIDGGIHAREWISPATVTYFINQFVENFDVESEDVKNINWYFVPVTNPDGYEYTHVSDRLWRKNRKPGTALRSCYGTDLNRNFGYRWGGKGASKNPCSQSFRGAKAFSEPESRAISDFIQMSGANFTTYLSYHSYGQYLLYPWGYDNVVPPDYKDLQALGEKVAEIIKKTGGSEYTVGPSSKVLYPAAGGSDDWAKVQGIKYTYTIELSDTGRHGFELPSSYIEPVAWENLAGLRVIAHQVNKEFKKI